MMGYEAETEKELKKSDIRTLLDAIITPERCRIEDVESVVEKCGVCEYITYSHNQPTTTSKHTRQRVTPLHSTRSDDRERHHRRRRLLKVLRQRERRSSSLSPEEAVASRIPRWTKVRNHMAVGLPIFIFLIGNPERTFMELLVTEEALEGSKHKFTTSLSSRLVAVPEDNLLPIERGLCWFVGSFASSSDAPFLWRTG